MPIFIKDRITKLYGMDDGNATLKVDTFLSPYVREIFKSATPCDVQPELKYTRNFTIVWEEIEADVNIIAGDENKTAENFLKAVSSLGCLFKECEMILKSSSGDDIQKIVSLAGWMRNNEVLIKCCRSFLNTDPTNQLEAVLILTSLFERSLGNILLLKGRNIPFLLRDLISSPELNHLLGPTVVSFLTILLGSPLGLNIRNIAWHGFLLPEEVNPQFSASLIITAASIGEILVKNNFILDRIPFRTLMNLNRYVDEFQDFPDLVVFSSEILNILRSSKFVHVSNYLCWEQIVKYYSLNRYDCSLLLIIPLLEQLLRCIYCTVNVCPQRMLTAESTSFYLILDDILSETIPPNLKNKLPDSLGEKTMEKIFDIFSSINGPRIRDKLSHGECNLDDVPKHLISFLLGLTVIIIYKVEYKNREDSDILMNNGNIFHTLLPGHESYLSKFHQSSLLKKQLKNLVRMVYDLRNTPIPNETLTTNVWNVDLQQIRFILDLESEFKMNTNFIDIDLVVKLIDKTQISTLFSPKNVTEVCTVCLRIVEQLKIVCNNLKVNLITKFEMNEKRKLRSRQRITYERILETAPKLFSCLNHVIILVTVQLCKMKNVEDLPEETYLLLIRFFQSIEYIGNNLASCTNAEKNHWVEVSNAVDSFRDHIFLKKNLLMQVFHCQ